MSEDREFSQAAMENIFRRALRRQVRPSESLTYAEMLETAREMGISESAFAAALAEYDEQGALDDARQQWLGKRRRQFLDHLRAYLIINGACLLLDLLLSGGVWFYYVMIGWGIGLAFDASDTFWPNPETVDRRARKILKREARLRQSGGKHRISVSHGKIIVDTPKRHIEIG